MAVGSGISGVLVAVSSGGGYTVLVSVAVGGTGVKVGVTVRVLGVAGGYQGRGVFVGTRVGVAVGLGLGGGVIDMSALTDGRTKTKTRCSLSALTASPRVCP